MRILHTSDWHLGKKLFKLDRTEEHKLFLVWLISILKEKEIDLLLVAGDIFDTPTPPHQSLEIFYEFLHQVSTETKTQSFIIAGNHDSGLLLEAPSKILAPHRVKVWGKLSPRPEDHWINIKVGNEVIDLCALPFFRSYELLPNGEGDAIVALNNYLKKESQNHKLLMLLHLAGNFEAAGSEQVISLSGVDSIPNEILSSFEYVALGHIHKPQKIGTNAYYSGSPIPMRFSETQQKSIRLLEVKNNIVTVEKLDIPVSRLMHIVKADEENWQEKIDRLNNQSPLTPMVEVQITLKQPTMGLLDEIKRKIEKKGMELLSFIPSYSAIEKIENRNEKLFDLSPLDVFKEFYKFKYPDSSGVSEELEIDFKELIQRVQNASDQT
jgi:exonuclease SbcD